MSRLDVNGRMNRYQDSFKWLEDAGVALPCYNVTAPQLPLSLNTKHNLFKLYMGDTGLLCANCLENVQFAMNRKKNKFIFSLMGTWKYVMFL